jgi:hypothetical protein
MFILALGVATLCVRCPAPSRDTITSAAVIDTVGSVPMVPALRDTLMANRKEPSASDSVPMPHTDTVPARRRKKIVAVEYSDWYSRRLTIHRWASYATLPLFAGNYVTGRQLFDKGSQAPDWAIRAHGPLAASVATLFAVNTLTGGWNLWDGRNDPHGRAWRSTHAVLMLAADAGFTTAGLLADQAERSDQRRRLHRTVALTSIGVSLVSYVMMIRPFRRD